MTRKLDRLVVGAFVRIFTFFVLSVPVMFILGDQSAKQGRYIDRGLSMQEIFWGYVFEYPKFVLWSFPVAALVGTVFTIHSMTVHREIQAAKAGGISFHRLVAPLWPVGAVLTVAAFFLGTLVTTTNRRAAEIFREVEMRRDWRNNFVFQTDNGEVLNVQELRVSGGSMRGVILQSTDADDVLTHMWARAASYEEGEGWTFREGHLRRVYPEEERERTFAFLSYRRAGFDETPQDLLQDPPDEEEMTYEELGRQAKSVYRSGGDPNKLLVEREQKLAIPAATLVIMLFGAPLATTVKKGGPTFGVGVSLGSTLVYILLMKLCGAIGIAGGLPPLWAAWAPNMIFLLVGIVLLTRVRT